MNRRRGMTIIEMLVVISIIAILIAFLMPALGSARRGARRVQSNANLSSIYESSVKFSLGNRDQFPGLDTSGNIVQAAQIPWSGSNGDVPTARFALLMEAGYLDPNHAISPFDKAAIAYKPLASSSSNLSKTHHSYAMQKIIATPHDGRTAAWNRETNPRAVLMADRNNGSNTTNNKSSLHTQKNKGQWHGSVCWGDGNVRFERTSSFSTVFPGGISNTSTNNSAADNIFQEDYDSNNTGEKLGDDAFLVYHNNSSGNNQN